MTRNTKTLIVFALCLIVIAVSGRIGGVSW